MGRFPAELGLFYPSVSNPGVDQGFQQMMVPALMSYPKHYPVSDTGEPIRTNPLGEEKGRSVLLAFSIKLRGDPCYQMYSYIELAGLGVYVSSGAGARPAFWLKILDPKRLVNLLSSPTLPGLRL